MDLYLLVLGNATLVESSVLDDSAVHTTSNSIHIAHTVSEI